MSGGAISKKVKRAGISKTIRFEVFKRDGFTCQYCGATAPEVVLHADHIVPVKDGGGNELLNLVTACLACNLGKGAKRLDDKSAVQRQRAQIEELEARREQLEMLLQWRDAAERERIDEVDEIGARIGDRASYVPNENGKANLRRWLKRYSFAEILNAADESFDFYMKWNGDEADKTAWEVAFAKIPAIAGMARQSQGKPYLRRLLYVQGILRNRTGNRRMNCVAPLESFHLDGLPVEDMEVIAKAVDSWEEFDARSEHALAAIKSEDPE